jgi:hypothetical protein
MQKTTKITACPIPLSPFELPELYIPPKNLLSLENKDVPYYSCPSWQHKAQRTFVFYSPVDIDLTLSSDGRVLSSNLTQTQFDECISLASDWRGPNHAVIQISSLMSWAFLTKEKDVWVHVHPDPRTSADNNFYCVEGWFNNSAWNRAINATICFHDLSKPVIIKRGDPIYRVSFYPKNLNQRVSLELGEIPPETLRKMQQRIASINWFKNKGFFKDLIFETKKSESKCPFSFLWNK